MTKKAYLITEINQTFTPLQRLVTFVLLLGQAKIKEGTTFSGRIFYYTGKQGASLKVKKKCWSPREGRMAGTLKNAEISSTEIFHKTVSPKIQILHSS